MKVQSARKPYTRKTVAPLFILLALLVASCSDTCSENKNALPLAGFYPSGGTEKISLDSLGVTGVGIPGDSALSEGGTRIDRLYLPFRIDSDTTRYVFRDAHLYGGARDTVTFIYSRTPRFVNVECGVSYIFGIRSITSQGVLIDSVTCPTGFIDNSNLENLKIYFAVTEEGE